MTPVRKALALRCLRKFFLAQLETDASWQTVFNRDVYAQLTDEIAHVDSEGITRACQVCCQDGVLLRCTLRANGRVNAATSPILPVLPTDWSIGAQANIETRRQIYGEALASRQGKAVRSDARSSAFSMHGSILFYLPSDFLCVICQSDVMALGVFVQDGIEDMLGKCRAQPSQDARVRSWFAKLDFNSASPDVDQTRGG